MHSASIAVSSGVGTNYQYAQKSVTIPLVSASLTHTQKYALDKIRFGNCTVDYYLNPRCHEIFEINLNAIESSNGLRLLCHNADLFNKNSVSKWLNEL